MGGTTASRNRYGQYLRVRAIPTNPNTAAQQYVRGYLAQLTSLWVNTLTAAQRDAWKTYADNVTVLDPLGQQVNLTALNHYVRSNVARMRAGLARIDAAPTVFDLGDFTPVSVTASEATNQISITFTTGDDWVDEDDAALIALCSRQQAPTINYFKGPYLYAGKVEGDSGTPPTSPATILVPFAITEDNKEFVHFRVTRADGRLSAPFRTGCIIAA